MKIDINNLGKRFGKQWALKDIDLNIPSGRTVALVGPNGSGKTTLIKCLLGLVRPTTGKISIDGLQLNGECAYRENIGYMPQFARYPGNLTVAEVLRMISDVRSENPFSDDQLLSAFGLEAISQKYIYTLSGGTRQKLSAAIAFRYDPDLLILDEPTAGLDPKSSVTLKDKILAEKRLGKTILISSHQINDLEGLCDDLVFILDGMVRYFGSADGLVVQTGAGRLERAVSQLMEVSHENGS